MDEAVYYANADICSMIPNAISDIIHHAEQRCVYWGSGGPCAPTNIFESSKNLVKSGSCCERFSTSLVMVFFVTFLLFS